LEEGKGQGHLASSRQYGKALLGVRHQEEECAKPDLKGITLSIIKAQTKKCDLSLRLKECKLSA